MNPASNSYKVIQPPQDLNDVVYAFWKMQTTSSAGMTRFRVMADGRPGILIPGRNVGSGSSLYSAALYGQTTNFDDLSFEPGIQIYGVVFQPHILKSLFGFNADEITDKVIDLECLLPYHKKSRHLQGEIENIIAVLRSLKEEQGPADYAIRECIEIIISTGGNVKFHSLHKSIRLSERQFERRFKQHTGITPVLFSRIARFQAALRQVKARQYLKLSDVAFDRGYADQAHFIRDFKEFSGFRPGGYHSSDRAITDMCKL